MIFKYYKLFFFIFLLFPSLVLAVDIDDSNKTQDEEIFRARVVEIINEKDNVFDDGSKSFQQDLKLEGLEGDFSGREVIFFGISDFDVINKNIYKVGDKVLVAASPDSEGNINYYITNYVRSGSLYTLFFIFLGILIVVGRWKGLRAALSLYLSFLVIVKFIIPKILDGSNPIFITVLGSILILAVVIYLTEGFNKKSHIASISIFISLLITIFISYIFVEFAKLTGLASEETAYIINIGSSIINFKGLLLAGIIIGTLGVLDDVVVAQITTVEQMFLINKNSNSVEIFKKAYEVGVSHISSMTNTLFLAYAGASMPLLLLFISGESAFSNFSQIINNELIATEIVRTLAGSIGLILSVPISTILAVYSFKGNDNSGI